MPNSVVTQRTTAVLLAILWFVGLWWVVISAPDMLPFYALLTAYVAGVAYATAVWSSGERAGTLAIVLAVILPMPGWFILLFHALGSSRPGR